MLRKLSDLNQLVKKIPKKKKLVLIASEDKSSLGAVYKAAEEGIIDPILVGNREKTLQFAKELKIDLSGLNFINEKDPLKAIETSIKLVSSNKADLLMKGKAGTSDVLKGVLNKEWGLRSGKLLNHFAYFEVETYHKLIAVTDVAMNIAPNLQDKINIVNNSVNFMNKLGIKLPKVAVLGAVEMVNESMQATTDAALLSIMNRRKQIKNCIIDGPLAFDNAVSIESAKHKGINSDIAGETDLLLMPDIEVGNVLYKSLVFFARAKVAAVVLGAKAPIVLTSRSDSEEAKYNSILLAAAAN